MNRIVLSIATCATLALPAVAGAESAWSPIPREAAVSILLTGADLGLIVPRGCHEKSGGAIYRPGLGRHLARRRPDLDTLWLSAGNFVRVPEDSEAVYDPRDMFVLYAMSGYGAVGLGRHDLDRAAASDLIAFSGTFDVPIVASNVVLLETGGPAFERSVVLEGGGRRIGVVSVIDRRPDDVWGDAISGTLVTVDPEAALASAIAAIEEDVDLVVLLSTVDSATLQMLLSKVDGVDVAASGWGTYARTAPERAGSTEILWLGNDGLNLGRVSLDREGRSLETRVAGVSAPFPVDPATGRPVELEPGVRPAP